MSGYAATTSVSTEQSRAEIERTLARWGVETHRITVAPTRAAIEFEQLELGTRGASKHRIAQLAEALGCSIEALTCCEGQS